MKKERLDKFSIRKLTVGAASVLIGVAFGATTVSAEKQPTPQAQAAGQQAAQVTELKDVKFTFKMGDKSATTEPVTVYVTKDGHYGFENDAAKCTSTAAQIVSAFLDKVTTNDDIKNAQGVAYPEKINAGENTVEVAAKPASNPVEHSDADLQKEAEKKADELQNQFAEEAKKAALEAAKKAAHKALNDAGITGAIFHKAIDNATTVESVKAYVAEFTYHFTYKGAETTVSTDYVAGSVDKAEQYFRAYASESGLNLDFTYDEATHTFVYKDFESEKGEPEVQPEAPVQKIVFHFQYDDKKGTSIRQDFAAVNKEIAEMHFKEYATESGLVLDDAHFAYNEANQTFVYKDFESEKGEPEVLPAPAVDVLAEAKKVAHEEFTKAGITGDIFHKAIDAAKTVEGLQAYVAETLAAHKTVEPVTPTPAPVVSGETGIGYLNLDMLSDGFTGTLYVPVVGKDVNCKVRLLDDAGKYTNDYVVTDTTVKALASKVVNGVTFYKVAENRWIPAKFAEVLSDKEVAFKGVAKTFVKGHANYAVAMLDADGKYTGKFLKQGSSFKVFAKKVINGHLCYRLGTQAQWVPARFLVF